MPYIPEEQRKPFYDAWNAMPPIWDKGELEYCVYKLMNKFMEGKMPNYKNLHDTVYAVIHAAHEYERRNLDVREDYAREVNGDID